MNGEAMRVPAAFVRVGDGWPVKDRPTDPAPRIQSVVSVAYDVARPPHLRLVVVTRESIPEGFACAPDALVWIVAAPGRVTP